MIHGLYYDRLHGHCLRRVERVSPTTYRVVGVYGDDEAPLTHRAWTATIRTTDGHRLAVDFAGKPIKTNRFMTAVYRDRQIHWSDGNVWRQLYVPPRTPVTSAPVVPHET